jgi:hypothetical protein
MDRPTISDKQWYEALARSRNNAGQAYDTFLNNKDDPCIITDNPQTQMTSCPSSGCLSEQSF